MASSLQSARLAGTVMKTPRGARAAQGPGSPLAHPTAVYTSCTDRLPFQGGNHEDVLASYRRARLRGDPRAGPGRSSAAGVELTLTETALGKAPFDPVAPCVVSRDGRRVMFGVAPRGAGRAAPTSGPSPWMARRARTPTTSSARCAQRRRQAHRLDRQARRNLGGRHRRRQGEAVRQRRAPALRRRRLARRLHRRPPRQPHGGHRRRRAEGVHRRRDQSRLQCRRQARRLRRRPRHAAEQPHRRRRGRGRHRGQAVSADRRRVAPLQPRRQAPGLRRHAPRPDAQRPGAAHPRRWQAGAERLRRPQGRGARRPRGALQPRRQAPGLRGPPGRQVASRGQ